MRSTTIEQNISSTWSEKNKNLIKRYQETNDEEILQKLLEENMGLSKFMANRLNLSCYSMTFQDLVQENHISLIKAIKYYDVDQGEKPSTYITTTMKNNITTEICKKDNIYKISKIQRKKYLEYKSFIDEYQNQYGITPTKEEIAKKLGMKQTTIDSFRNLDNLTSPLSSSAIVSSPEKTGIPEILENKIKDSKDIIVNCEEQMDEVLLLKGLYDLLKRKQYYILYHTVLNPSSKTQEAVGEELELTKKAVNISKSRVLEKLRENPNILQELRSKTIKKYGLNIPDQGELYPINPKLRLTLHFLKETLPLAHYTVIYTKVCNAKNDNFAYYQKQLGEGIDMKKTLKESQRLMESVFTKEKIGHINEVYRENRSIDQILELNILPEEKRLDTVKEEYLKLLNEQVPFALETGPVKQKKR